jgi:hypothetical protein
MSYFDVLERHQPASRGPWRIEIKHIPDTPEERMRAVFASPRRTVPPGTYVGLVHQRRGVVMSDTPSERREHIEAYVEAKRRGGRCLVHGLGIGMVLHGILSCENVEHVDVVELDPDVIALTGPAFQEEQVAGRLTIHQDDCFTKKWTPGTRWQVVWHDVWDDLCEDNLEQMAKLHRSYGRRADWQGSWGKEQLEYLRRSGGGWGW